MSADDSPTPPELHPPDPRPVHPFVHALADNPPLVQKMIEDHQPEADLCASRAAVPKPCTLYLVANLAMAEVVRRRLAVLDERDIAAAFPEAG